jgi:peptidoglycan/xylan/chitin deacetylase (PgdA/CDA1 family)
LLGEPGYMTRTQLLEMVAAGIVVGAHSRTHADLRACDPAALEREVRGSKEDLENLIGKPVTSFAYPTGLLNDQVVAAVSAAGFVTAVTTRPGWWRRATGDLVIPRGFAEEFSDATFRAATRGGLGILRPFDAINRLLPARPPSRPPSHGPVRP